MLMLKAVTRPFPPNYYTDIVLHSRNETQMHVNNLSSYKELSYCEIIR